MAAVCVVILVGLFCVPVVAALEQGKWTLSLNQDYQFGAVGKNMFNDTKVTVTVSLMCDDGAPDGIEISWILRASQCAGDFVGITEEVNSVKTNQAQSAAMEMFMRLPILRDNSDQIEWLHGKSSHNCTEEDFKLSGVPDQRKNVFVSRGVPDQRQNVFVSRNGTWHMPKSTDDTVVLRKQGASAATPGNRSHAPNVASAWEDASYLFIIRLRPKERNTSFSAKVTVRTFYGDGNYISATDYPLVILYGVMGLVSVVYGLVWLVLLARNWRDLLRVQFWIGGVILLGLLENVLFFALYDNINNTGQIARGLLIFLDFVSSLSGSVFRMLFMIVSVGFTIAKPRLGRTLYTVLILGGLYFVLFFTMICIAQDMLLDEHHPNDIVVFVCGISVLILELIVWIWVLLSLRRTLRILKRTNQVVKLRLYRLFTVTLVLAVLAAVAYVSFSVIMFRRLAGCFKDREFLWISEIFWPISVAAVLLVIMLLWRPSANNQRYAFSPLLDAADKAEDEDDTVIYDAADGMTMAELKDGGESPKALDPNN